jgi:hypothetical protein
MPNKSKKHEEARIGFNLDRKLHRFFSSITFKNQEFIDVLHVLRNIFFLTFNTFTFYRKFSSLLCQLTATYVTKYQMEYSCCRKSVLSTQILVRRRQLAVVVVVAAMAKYCLRTANCKSCSSNV